MITLEEFLRLDAEAFANSGLVRRQAIRFRRFLLLRLPPIRTLISIVPR